MAQSSMKQSWGLGLLVLGAAVLIEGEPPVPEQVGKWYGG